jgi:hypothetical protein
VLSRLIRYVPGLQVRAHFPSGTCGAGAALVFGTRLQLTLKRCWISDEWLYDNNDDNNQVLNAIMRATRLKLVGKELNFQTIDTVDVPHGRKGKHNALIGRIIQDLQRIEPGTALKVPVSALGSQKIENVRAALARELKKIRLVVGTAIDDDYFYVWRRKS